MMKVFHMCWTSQRARPNSYRLMKSPITRSCIWSVLGIFAYPPSCRAPHEERWAKNPTLGTITMIIPHEMLSVEALQGVIEAFVTREGTEYGTQDVSLATKVLQVQQQL